jgi:transcriptional regulator with XRE-family HTH domain
MKEELIEFIFKEAARQSISMNQLSKIAKVSRYQLQNLAHGRTAKPTITTINALYKSLGYTLKPQKIEE